MLSYEHYIENLFATSTSSLIWDKEESQAVSII